MFIPEGVSESTLQLLKEEEAEVVVKGKFYAEAWNAAKEMAEKDPGAVLIPAYNDPIVWEGHSSMIKEIHAEIPKKPAAIFCSVGGAGLLGGVLEGCKAVGWQDGVCVVRVLVNVKLTSVNSSHRRSRNHRLGLLLPLHVAQ